MNTTSKESEESKRGAPKSERTKKRSRRAVARYAVVLLAVVMALLVFSYFASNREVVALDDEQLIMSDDVGDLYLSVRRLTGNAL